MSDLANKDRADKQRWAVPGSSHDRLVRFAKVALPSAVGVVIASARAQIEYQISERKVSQAGAPSTNSQTCFGRIHRKPHWRTHIACAAADIDVNGIGRIESETEARRSKLRFEIYSRRDALARDDL